MNARAAALLILLTSPGCSGEAASNAPGGPETVQVAMPERPDGPVLDQAGVLPPESEASLDERLRRLWSETGDALVVVTVASLEGESIEDYAFTLFNEWGIGDADTDRGLLFLVAPNERRVRIEVGCGLESTVTDAVALEIIEQRIVPTFRDGDFVGGTEAGVESLIARLALPKPANDPGPHSEPCRDEARKAA